MGPLASVITPDPPSLPFANGVEDFLGHHGECRSTPLWPTTVYIRADSSRGNPSDDDRPFEVDINDFDPEDDERPLTATQVMAFRDVFNIQPKSEVDFAALCGSELDHRCLASLCHDFGIRRSGVICFNGCLPIPIGEIDRTVKVTDEFHRIVLMRSAATLCRLEITPEGATPRPVDFGEPLFLKWWLRQPHFSMIK